MNLIQNNNNTHMNLCIQMPGANDFSRYIRFMTKIGIIFFLASSGDGLITVTIKVHTNQQ